MQPAQLNNTNCTTRETVRLSINHLLKGKVLKKLLNTSRLTLTMESSTKRHQEITEDVQL